MAAGSACRMTTAADRTSPPASPQRRPRESRQQETGQQETGHRQPATMQPQQVATAGRHREPTATPAQPAPDAEQPDAEQLERLTRSASVPAGRSPAWRRRPCDPRSAQQERTAPARPNLSRWCQGQREPRPRRRAPARQRRPSGRTPHLCPRAAWPRSLQARRLPGRQHHPRQRPRRQRRPRRHRPWQAPSWQAPSWRRPSWQASPRQAARRGSGPHVRPCGAPGRRTRRRGRTNGS